jgi:2OG-Fe(II) oxygenase superfamily
MKRLEEPYKHYIEENFFTLEQFQLLCDFIENSSWVYYDHVDFPQYIIPKQFVQDFFLNRQASKNEFSFLFERDFIISLEPLFEISLEKCVGISVHKLIYSNFNIVHNDYNEYDEKFRIVCYLSNPETYEGGELNLYSIRNLKSPFISHKLKENTAFIFEMNQQSFHSVSKVTSGERVCIVITYQ